MLNKLYTTLVRGGVLGILLGAFVLAPSAVFAYQQVYGEEGTSIKFTVKLPAMPHEARVRSRGYKSVRYDLCTEDGTAKGVSFSLFSTTPSATGTTTDPDYFLICNYKLELTSKNNFSKYYDFSWITFEDELVEGDEYFWVKLKNPEVIKGGQSNWQSWSGSSHVPSSITVQVNIQDND